MASKEELDPDGYDQLMYTQNVETIEPFSSHVHTSEGRKGLCWRIHINIMAQALQTEDDSLPQGLTVKNLCTELRQGSKKTVMMVRNNTAYSQTLQKKTPVARAVSSVACAQTP